MYLGCKQDVEEIKDYMVPSLEELGHDVSSLGTTFYPGGETEALRRMEENIKKTVSFFFNFEVTHFGTLLWYWEV